MAIEQAFLPRVNILKKKKLDAHFDNVFRSPPFFCAQNPTLLFITLQIVTLHRLPGSCLSVLFKFEQIVSTIENLL